MARTTETKMTVDERLRTWGFRIWSRPKDGPPLWMSEERIVLTQAGALQAIERALAELESRRD